MDQVEAYIELGRVCRRTLSDLLADDWSWDGKSVLDFGCGAGRTLRHFVDVPNAEFWGADIDAASIDWAKQNLSPMRFVLNTEIPPSPLSASAFDLVYAISVFSHLSDHWASWLLDIHRVLKPGGLLIATFMGEGMIERIAGEPWDDNKIGMACYVPGTGWDGGGPMVLLSPWWIEEHWGRLFHIDRVLPLADSAEVIRSLVCTITAW